MLFLNSVRVAPGVRSALAVACGVALFAALPVWADDEGLEPVVVTATRAPVAISQLVSDVTTLTRKDIDRAVAADLSDLLRQQPGLEIARSGGPGSVASVFTRGADNRFTSLMIDGVRVASQSGDGGAPWMNIPLSQIERIEIVRGPASAVYGSDAVAGVVQVFTRKAHGPQSLELGVGVGSQGTSQGDALISGQQGAVDYLLGMSTARSRGASAVVQPSSSSYNPDVDGYRSRSSNGRLGWQINQEHRIEVNAMQSNLDAQYDAYGSTGDDHSVNNLNSLSANWSAQWLDAWRSRLSVSDALQQYETKPAGYGSQTRARAATLQHDVQFGIHGLHVISEMSRDELDNSGLTKSSMAGQADRTVSSSALGYDLRKNGHALQINARTDHDSDFGRHNTGSIAIGVQVMNGWRVTASTSNAFRAPTLYQRFSAYGFEGLKPESSRNVEAGLSYKQANVSASVTAYRNHITDLIDYADGCNCYQNVGRAVLKGLTVQSGWDVAGVRVSGSLDLLSSRNEDTGEQLLRRARRRASVQADTDVAGWTARVQWQAASRRGDMDWDAYPAEPVSLPGYGVVNLMLARALSPDWMLRFKVDNALQQPYQTAHTYGGTERKLMVTLRWAPAQ